MDRTRSAAHSIEAYRLVLDEGERQALRSAPGDFLRKMLEDEGHAVNAILIDAALSDPGCVDTELVHLLEGFMASTWGLRCILQQ
jgi:hypothetical protein